MSRLLLTTLFLAFLHASTAVAADTQTDDPLSGRSVQDEGRMEKSSRLISNAFFNLDDDLKGIALYPIEHTRETLFFLGGIGALVAVDKPVTRYYQDKVEPVFNGYTIKTPGWGANLGLNGADSYLVSGIAGSYALGIAFNDEKSQQAALLATKASIYSIMLSHLLLKAITGRQRPVSNLSTATGDKPPFTTDPYAFGHFTKPTLGSFSGGSSMPSYHFTQYFAVARVYAKVYDNYLIPYGVAAALLTADIKSHRHWVADMVAGALIGTMIGSVVAGNAEDTTASTTMVFPAYSGEQISLNIYHQF